MKGRQNNSESDIGAFLHDLEEQNKVDSPSADLLILSDFLRRKTNKHKMSKRSIAILAYQTQKALCRS